MDEMTYELCGVRPTPENVDKGWTVGGKGELANVEGISKRE